MREVATGKRIGAGPSRLTCVNLDHVRATSRMSWPISFSKRTSPTTKNNWRLKPTSGRSQCSASCWQRKRPNTRNGAPNIRRRRTEAEIDLPQGPINRPDRSCPAMDWQPIATAPFDRDLELAVIETDCIYALVFPCRRAQHGWMKSKTGTSVDIHPTHWREWTGSGPPR